VWKEDENSNKSELGIGHVKLIKVDVRILLLVGLTSQSDVWATGQRLSVYMKTGQHRRFIERFATFSHRRVVDLWPSIRMIHLAASVIVHIANDLDGSPSWIILLPHISEIPGRHVNHRSNVALERFQDGLGFLRKDERLIKFR
jgi:hypothetical protein